MEAFSYTHYVKLATLVILTISLPAIGYKLAILLPMKADDSGFVMSTIMTLLPQIAVFIVINDFAVRLTRCRFLWMLSALIPFEMALIYILFCAVPCVF